MADEVFEAYSDTFDAIGNVYGVLINFKLSPPEPSSQQLPTIVARLRMSWEMGKVLTCLLLRTIKKAELDRQVSYPIPIEVLNQLKIPPEDWDNLWATPKFDFGG